MELNIPRISDFEPDGTGSNPEWNKVEWIEMQQVGNVPSPYNTRTKVGYSETGMYFLVECEDEKISCTEQNDMDDIFKEDVVEVFLWPNMDKDMYFEYEISPLDKELVLIIPNHEGEFFGWLPWHYEKERKVKKKATVIGGRQKPGANIKSWIAEFFVPFTLLLGFGNVPPKPGMKWKGNIYRMDYDHGPISKWAWDPAVGGEFHQFKDFGTFIFE